MMLVRVKKLHPEAVLPKQGTAGSAGYDLTAVSVDYDPDTGTWCYHTGLAFEIPAGHVGYVFPRSSIYKQSLRLTNCVGVIDSDYRGEVTAVFEDASGKEKYGVRIGHSVFPARYLVGDRIAQMVIMPVPSVEFIAVDELTETERGTGGYGSTGR